MPKLSIRDLDLKNQRVFVRVDFNVPISAEGVAEAQEFLRWAAADHFTFLGYREYAVASLRRNAGE